MPHWSHSSWFGHSDNIWRGVQESKQFKNPQTVTTCCVTWLVAVSVALFFLISLQSVISCDGYRVGYNERHRHKRWAAVTRKQ
jgi:hypothetical protein